MAQDDQVDRPGRKHDLGKAIIRAGEVAGGVVAIGGLVGDFLKPLAEVNLIVFLVASALSLMLLYLCLKRRTIFGYGFGVACLFCLIVAAGFGTWWKVADSKGGQKQGILASKFDVVSRVQGAVLDVRKVDGAQVVTKVEKEEAGTKASREGVDVLLHDYPATLLAARTVGDLRPSAEPGGQVLVSYDLSIGVNPSTYDEFATKLEPLLDAAASRKGEVFCAAPPAKAIPGHSAFEALLPDLLRADEYLMPDKLYDLAKVQQTPMFQPARDREGFGNDWWVDPVDPDREMVVVLNTARNQVGDRATWRWFHVGKLDGLPTRERIDVAFLDSRGREVVRDALTIGPLLPGLTLSHRNLVDKSWKALELIICPAILCPRGYASEVTIPRQLKMTKDELKRVASIRCTAAPVAAKTR